MPYLNGPNPCALNCMPRSGRFYHRLSDNVVDGTRCSDNPGDYDVCVEGKCQVFNHIFYFVQNTMYNNNNVYV